MSPLRQKMIDLMTVKNYSPATHESYLSSMISLVKYYRCSPELLTQEDIQSYLIYLVKERHLSSATCRLQLQGIRFFYRHVLKWSQLQLSYDYPKKEQRIPDLLTRSEVKRVIEASNNLKHQAILKTSYGTGVRVSELVTLKVADIDSERHLLRIEQGKGAKDRLVPLPPSLLVCLRNYWRQDRPGNWLFPGRPSCYPLHSSTVSRILKKAKQLAGVTKRGGIHSLRHAYATHSLELGVPIHLLQRWLGHSDVRTTLRYVHWIPVYNPHQANVYDLLSDSGS